MSDQNSSDSSDTVIGKDRVVRLHYSVLDTASGQALETTAGSDPLTLLYGTGSMLAAVERALEGKGPGDQFEVVVEPAQAFGPRKDNSQQRLSKKYFRNPNRLRPGQRTSVQTDQGRRPVTVIKVGGKMVDVDTNHPYAGRTLTFSLDILEVRPATSEELAHGHAHGPGGHAH